MRLIRLRSNLDKLKETLDIDLVVYEAATGRGRSNRAVIVQCELQGQVKSWCEDNKIDYEGIAPTELKKFATGSGRASKEQMIDTLEKRLRRIFEDSQHDEVDAIWLLEMAKERYEIS